MENGNISECSIMEEVREMREKISAEFGHDLNRLVAYYQEVENEMRKSGKYKFSELPKEDSKSAEGTETQQYSSGWNRLKSVLNALKPNLPRL